MTDAEELELLELEEAEAKAKSAAPQVAAGPEQTPTLDAMGTGLQHFGRHIAGGNHRRDASRWRCLA